MYIINTFYKYGSRLFVSLVILRNDSANDVNFMC